MNTVNEILQEINLLAPFNIAMGFDNCGLLVGSKDKKIVNCIIALDITNEVIDYAKKNNAGLIITHHPIIFNPLKSIKDDSLVFKLIKNDISVISAHTNLDIATGGVNDALASLLNLENISIIENTDEMGRIGSLNKPMSAMKLAKKIKTTLNAKGVTVTCKNKEIKKVALLGGAGGDYFKSALLSGADVFITGETKHNILIDSINLNVPIITAGHYYTEAPVLYSLKDKLKDSFKEINFNVYDFIDLDEA